MTHIMPKLTTIFVLLLTANSLSAQSMQTVRLNDRTSIEFVSVDQGREFIGRRDTFVARTSALERQFRLFSRQPVSIDHWLTSMQEGVRVWKQNEIDSLTKIIKDLGSKLLPFDLKLPERVYLIRVAGSVEANMPHCRGPSIVLPDRFFSKNSPQESILAHELFHVLCSHNPSLRNKLYAIIGYKPCNEIVLPKSLERRRLTNPDAPTIEHRIEITSADGEHFSAVPILTLDTDQYTGGVFVRHMRFQLMVVERNTQDQWVAKLIDGKPVLWDSNQVPDFQKQIGRNTGYIIHPEETLADNFSLLVAGKDGVPDPWVIEGMRKVLTEQ